MPAYNFKERFAGNVEEGTKRQTIRANRKRPTVPGDILYLYKGMRTKNCRKLRQETCLSVESIMISLNRIDVDGINLSYGHCVRLAIADGFGGIEDFYQFFEENHGLPFEGVLIKW